MKKTIAALVIIGSAIVISGSMFDVKRFNLTRCLDCGFPVNDEDAVPDEWGDVV